MNRAIGICSLLHEETSGSAARLFRERGIDGASVGPIAAARRWSDGWRGGLLQTCDFDAGFDAEAVITILAECDADLAMLIEPSAGLIDPSILDALLLKAIEKTDEQIFIAPAAPGLSAVVLRRSLVEKLAAAKIHPGKLLHYLPEHPTRDPLGSQGCVDLPVTVKRAAQSFRFDSERQIDRLTAAMEPLNGQLRTADAATIVAMRSQAESLDRLPREIVLELNTDRRSRAIFRHATIQRPTMTKAMATALLNELSDVPDIRLTIAGMGDPLETDVLFEVIESARMRGIRAMHVETDLLSDGRRVGMLGTSCIDVVTVHLPSMTASMYAKIMGIDALAQVLNNIAALLKARLSNMIPTRRRAFRRFQSRLSVLCDGTVVACEQDIAGRRPIGRLGEQPLSEIWCDAMKPVRDSHARGEWTAEHPLCGSCAEWNRP